MKIYKLWNKSFGLFFCIYWLIIFLKETLKINLVNWNILVTKKEIKKDFVSSGERKRKRNYNINLCYNFLI